MTFAHPSSMLFLGTGSFKPNPSEDIFLVRLSEFVKVYFTCDIILCVRNAAETTDCIELNCV